jgi:hypothetical protein
MPAFDSLKSLQIPAKGELSQLHNIQILCCTVITMRDEHLFETMQRLASYHICI